jgi:hypothetical protein
MAGNEPYRHRIPLPAGAAPIVSVGDNVVPGDPLARTVRPVSTLSVPLARPLHRKKGEVPALLVAQAGQRVRTNQPIARTPDRDVRAPVDGLLLGYDAQTGNASLLAIEPSDSIVSNVQGVVMEVDGGAVTIAVPAVALHGAAGTGAAVHGVLTIMVSESDAPIDPASIDADAAGRILVGGSWASAEAITRARAVGVAAIVVGGLHARDLADFTGLQHRRSLLGTAAPPFAVLALDGFGQSAMDPARFAWLRSHADHQATVLGDQRRLLVFDAAPAPTRVARATVGDRVVIVAGPGRGQAGLLSEVPVQPLAIGSGISALCGLVRLDAGRTVAVALANLEASPSPA